MNEITILLVEDSSTYAAFIKDAAEQADIDSYHIDVVTTLADAKSHLAKNAVDLILLDLTLPDSSGHTTFTKIREHAKECPIVILTAAANRELALALIREGAEDYLVKDVVTPTAIFRVIRYALERKHASADLKDAVDSVTRLRSGMNIVESIHTRTHTNASLSDVLAHVQDDLLHVTGIRHITAAVVDEYDGHAMIRAIFRTFGDEIRNVLAGHPDVSEESVFSFPFNDKSAAGRMFREQQAQDLTSREDVYAFFASLVPDEGHGLEPVLHDVLDAISCHYAYICPLTVLNGKKAYIAFFREKRISDETKALITLITQKISDTIKMSYAARELREHKRRFRSITDNTRAGYFFLDTNGVYRDVNEAFVALHKYEKREEILGKHFSLLQVPKDEKDAEHIFSAILQTNTQRQEEFSRLCKDGSIGYHIYSAEQVVENGEPIGVEGFIIDTTERKKAEKNLLIAETSIERAALEIFRISEEGFILYANATACERLGYTKKEIVGKHVGDIDPDYPKGMRKAQWKKIQRHKRVQFESRHITKDGFIYPVEVTSNYFTSGDEEFEFAFVNDISKRKRFEDDLLRLRDALEKSLNAFYILDANLTFVYANKAYLRMWGYESLDEILGTPPNTHFTRPETLEKLHRESLRMGSATMELTARRKHGSTFDVVMSMFLYTDRSGKTFFAASSLDVTERNLIANELREKEERLRLALDASNDGLWDWDLGTGEAYFSPRYYTMLGYDPNEFAASREAWELLLHPDDYDKTVNEIDKLLASKARSFRIEFRLRKKDDTWLWVLGRGKVVSYDEERRPARMMGTHVDISHEKEIETALRRSEQKYASLFNELVVGFALHEMIYDDAGQPIDYRFLEVNPAFEQLTGLRSEDLLGKRVREVLPGTEQYWIEQYGEVATTEKFIRIENYSRELDRFYEVVAYAPHKGYFATIINDVTLCKKQELRERALLNTLGLLSDIARMLNEASTYRQIYSIIGEGITRVFPTARIIITCNRANASYAFVEHLVNFHETWENALLHARINREATKGIVRTLSNGTINRLPDTIKEIFEAAFATEAYEALEYARSNRVCYSMGLIERETFLGSVSFFIEEDDSIQEQTATIEAIIRQATVALNRVRSEEAVTRELSEKRQSIAKAQELQYDLNTRNLPVTKDLSLYAAYIPSEELGGDFFDIHKHDDEHISIILGDCMGHGIEASMYATLLKSLADKHMPLLANGAPGEYLAAISEDFAQYAKDKNYPTMFVCHIEDIAGSDVKQITYANANAPLPYITGGGATRRLKDTKGFHIGFTIGMPYTEEREILRKGETFFLFSDALLEITREGVVLFTERDIKDTLARFSVGTKANYAILRGALDAVANESFSDDMTLVFVEYTPPYTEHVVIHTPDDFTRLNDALASLLPRFNFTEATILNIGVGFEEMFMNAYTHGNESDDLKNISISYTITPSLFEMSIEDEGEGFNPKALPDPTNLDRLLLLIETDDEDSYTHGRGVWMTRQYMDEVAYNEKGNKVTIRKRNEASESFFPAAQKAASPRKGVPMKNENVIRWSNQITFERINRIQDDTVSIDLRDSGPLTSNDIGLLLRIAKHTYQAKKQFHLYFNDPTLYQIILKLQFEEIEGVSLHYLEE